MVGSSRVFSNSPKRVAFPVGWACRTGVCHSCESALVSGSVEYGARSARPAHGRQYPHLLLQAQGDVEIDLIFTLARPHTKDRPTLAPPQSAEWPIHAVPPHEWAIARTA